MSIASELTALNGYILGAYDEINTKGGTVPANKNMANLEAFRDNRMPVMVATKAFGMGIDKPNVRYTVNVNYSNSLEAFVQEAGRAGRDRAMALATILVSDYRYMRINDSCPDNLFRLPAIQG